MARPSSAERARRLVALLGQLPANRRIPLEVLADRLGISKERVTSDLITLSMCGLAPYDPFDLVPVMVDGDYVEVFGEIPALKGPVRLSLAETNALAAALEAAGFSADDELVHKLISAASAVVDGAQVERSIRASVNTHDHDIYAKLAQAIAERQVLRIEYTSSGEGLQKCRDIEPVMLFAEKSVWYAKAWCRRAEGWRTFRLDHMLSAVPTGDRFDERPVDDDAARAFDPAGLPKARLRFSASEAFDEREWPGGLIVETGDDGSVLAEVPYAGTGWIARRVCARLGGVTVVSPSEVRERVYALAGDLARNA